MALRKTHIATIVVGVAIVGSAVLALQGQGGTTITADQPVGNARLTMASQVAKVGEEFEVPVILHTGEDETSGVDLVISYDPAVLTVVDSAADVDGTQIVDGKLFDFVQANRVSNSAGQIIFSTGQQPVSPPVATSDQAVATIRFKAIAAGESALNFYFKSGSVADTNVIRPVDGRDLLRSVQQAIITVAN